MQAAVDANVAYQARNDPEYQQLVAQQQEMRGPGALGAMQVGQASVSRPPCLHVVPVAPSSRRGGLCRGTRWRLEFMLHATFNTGVAVFAC